MPLRFPDGLPAVLPSTITRIERRLPSAGVILVHIGSHVEPDDLIGRCSVQGEPVLLDAAGTLGIEPRDVGRRMRRKPGEHVAFRDVLARRRRHSLLAPFPGTLTAVDEATGFVVLTPDPMPASVAAMVRGHVVDVEPTRAATIETAAAVVQGAAGFGGEQWGRLRVLTNDPAAGITPEMIDAQSAFAVIAGGAGITAEALHQAQKQQVKGVIVGSIDARVLYDFWGSRFDGHWSQMLRMGAPVSLVEDGPTLVVTEGFGQHPMSRPIFDLLVQCDGQEAHLDGTTRLDAPQRRPRVVVPLAQWSAGAANAVPAQRPAAVPALTPGAQVRLLDEAHLGMVGRVESLRPQGRLPSGVRTATATVQIGDHERVVLPELALEVIGM